MQELRLVAVSEDGTYLVLATAGRGTRFTLPVDDRLRAAVRGNFSRLGQYEIEVESPLRPKEIQARIRAGETAEEIAATAGIPVERVRWFEGPVLQEREYMAQQAQRVAVRLPGETTPGPTLGELVAERLTRRGVPADEIDWDSSKRDDNLWRVKLGFVWNGHTRHAEWLFDPRRRHITPNDDEAMRLSAAEYVDPEPEDATVRPFVPRLASKLAPVQPLPQVTPPERDERGLGVPAVRPEPAALAEPVSPPRLSSPPRPEPGRPEPYADEPAAYRPELTPVPFRLPQSLIATPGPVVPPPAAPDATADAGGSAAETTPTGVAPVADGDAPAPAGGEDAAAVEPAVPRPAPVPAAGPDDDTASVPAEPPSAAGTDETADATGRAPIAVPPPAPPVEAAAPPAEPAAQPAAAAAENEPAQPSAAPVTPTPAAPAAAASGGGQGKPRAGEGPKGGAKEGPKETKPETPAPPVPKPAPPRPRKSRGRRASVPTWDEIMFGARKQD